ncbi:MAG: T9SS type A sorting domain-containing protein [bacterium]
MKRFFVLATILLTSDLLAQGIQPSERNEDFDDGALQRARNAYFYDIRTSGEEKDLTVINQKEYDAMMSMENRNSFKSLSNPAWIQIAGSQENHNSGRIRDIVADPANPNTVYVATGSGGVWKCQDITSKPTKWIDLSERLPTLLCGAMALDPKNPNILFLGTGESPNDGYKYMPGAGIFRSTDAGNNWTSVAPTTKAGGVCTQILIDSIDSKVIYVATASSSGLLKSTDGGDTWRKLTKLTISPTSIAYNAKNPLTLIVSGYGNIYRSVDSGATWTKTMTGITGSVGAVSVANAPGNANLFYATVSTGNGVFNGLFMSNDGGVNWKKMSGYDATLPGSNKNINPLARQGDWCNSITVRPSNPKQIFVAGLDTYMSNDSGVTWTQITDWNPGMHTYPGNYVHADHHRILFIGNTLYDCGDGGLAKASAPFINAWSTDCNHGLSTLQFVGVATDKNFTFVTGGCQDNSTNRASINDTTFTQTRGGDGGRGWVSSNDPSIVYTTYVRTTFYQSTDSGKSFPGANLIEQNTALYRIDESGFGNGEGSPFYPAYDVSRDGEIVAFGGNSHMWISTTGGSDEFTAVPPSASTKMGTYVNAVHVFQGEDATNYMWSAAGNNVWRSVDQGNTWVSKSVGEAVYGITSNPKNRNEVYAVSQGVGATQKHFFKSSDGGATFTSPATNFPNIGCWSVAVNPNDGMLFVGTDKGVVYSFDGGVTWNPLMNGMPLAEVLSLTLRGVNNDKLLAGTYGRGVFWIDIGALKGVDQGNVISELALDPVFPNPLSSQAASIGFSIKNSGVVTLKLHDVLGREVKILEKSYFDQGKHSVSFEKNNLPTGTYYIMLTSNGHSVSQKFVIE